MNFGAVVAIFKARLKVYMRYPGWLIMNFIYPVFMAIIPVILGLGIAGSFSRASSIFMDVAGTEEFVFYVILGSTVWSVSTGIIWDFGMWLYEEMEAGTLEQLMLTPVSPMELLLGSVSYTLIVTAINSFLGLFLASAILGCLHLLLSVRTLLGVAVIVLGFIPLLGLSLFFGALVLRMKEPWSVFNFLTAFLAYIAGIFYPITVLPKVLQLIAVLFPPTIQIADSRAIILGVSPIFGLHIDILILVVYAFIWPLFGLIAFRWISEEARRKGSIGGY